MTLTPYRTGSVMNLCILPREMYCTSSAKIVTDSSSLPTDLTANTVNVLILPVAKPARKSVPSTPLPKNTKMTKSIRRTQKYTAGWTPENVLCIFPKRNLPNGAKLPVRSVKCAKMGRFPLKNFRLGWMRVSVDNLKPYKYRLTTHPKSNKVDRKDYPQNPTSK